MTPELDKLLAEAVQRVKAMSKEDLDAMMKAQAESWIQAETSWPKSNYHYENGVKVYHSYEDYCND